MTEVLLSFRFFFVFFVSFVVQALFSNAQKTDATAL
jgi:hypothetical protein